MSHQQWYETVQREEEWNDRCILWTGAKAGSGYGVKSVNGKMTYVHRQVAEQRYGPIPIGMVVAHTCDVPACINPEHLVVCTQAENLSDMVRKGRSAKGEKHRSKTHPELVLKGSKIGTSKLSERDVQSIRDEYKPYSVDASLSALASKYGVTFQTIHKIVKGQRWKHL